MEEGVVLELCDITEEAGRAAAASAGSGWQTSLRRDYPPADGDYPSAQGGD
jgi:hypothetical protein